MSASIDRSASRSAPIRAASLALCLLAMPVHAGATVDVSGCTAIADDVVRLFCYDRAAGIKTAPAPAAAAKAVATPAPAETPSASAAPTAAIEPTAPASTPRTPAEPAPPAKAEKSGRIESRIVGHFQGWSPGTKFTLENGQVWIAVGQGTYYKVLESPKVVIQRDFFGQSEMRVEGIRSTALVQRDQ